MLRLSRLLIIGQRFRHHKLASFEKTRRPDSQLVSL